MPKIIVINGPNLNRLGVREPDIYGNLTLDEINNKLFKYGQENGAEIDFFQSNSEGEIIDKIQKSSLEYNGAIINPAAYSHYSYAISDAIKSVNIPFVEVHISNIFKRENFRANSVTAPPCIGLISGLGDYVYILGILSLLNYLKK